jgi:uncharacterized membrane protein YozB (DUF420 family)
MGVIYFALNLFSYTRLGFNHQTQAFGSIFAVMAVFQMLTIFAALVMSAVTLFWFLRSARRSGEEEPRRHKSVTDIALFWYYTAAAGVVTYLLLYIAPQVI